MAMTITAGTLTGIAAHYEHAQEKNPYFADKFCDEGYEYYELIARMMKKGIDAEAKKGTVRTDTVLDAEIAEMFAELARGDMDRAREEAFDVIAVVLRIIDVIDGRAQFGDPAKREKEASK